MQHRCIGGFSDLREADCFKTCLVHDRCEDTWWVLFIHFNIKIIMIGTLPLWLFYESSIILNLAYTTAPCGSLTNITQLTTKYIYHLWV